MSVRPHWTDSQVVINATMRQQRNQSAVRPEMNSLEDHLGWVRTQRPEDQSRIYPQSVNRRGPMSGEQGRGNEIMPDIQARVDMIIQQQQRL